MLQEKIIFENLQRIAAAIAKQLNPFCEVVVHDLSCPENSIVYIGGSVTGRRVGGPLTDFVLNLLEDHENPEDVVSYMAYTENGVSLKSSTIFIKNDQGNPIGVVCINFDTSFLFEAAQQLTRIATPENPLTVNKSFSSDVPSLLQSMINKSLTRVTDGKLLHLRDGTISKNLRSAIISDLEKQGAFRIRNAIPLIADLFEVSRYTIYKDIKSVREKDTEKIYETNK